MPAELLTLADAADELGVAPARVRALLAAGALTADDDGRVPAAAVAELARRGTLRTVDVAAVEGALDRALRRRLPGLLEDGLGGALAPLSGEVATALADVEISTRELAAAQERATVAVERARRAEEALGRATARVAVLEAHVAALEARPVGLFRRRRSAGVVPA